MPGLFAGDRAAHIHGQRGVAVQRPYRSSAWDVVLTPSGVGYAVRCPLPLVDGAAVELWVRTTMTQEQITLFGFETELERNCYDALCKVQKVGPSIALAVLATLTPGALAAAVATNNVDAVTSAKGVGRKTAEMIVAFVELPADLEPGASAPSGDLVDALVALGYDTEEASGAISGIATDVDLGDESAALAAALLYLGRVAA